MKKHLLIALVLGLSTTICHSQVKISVQGGTGLTGITQNENYNANFGYRFGVGVEFPIDKTWSMQTGLQLLNRSYSIDEAVTALGITETGKQIYMGLGIDSKINGIYLQVPIKVAAYLPLNNNCGLQFSGGPYIALGIGGKSKLNWVLATNERYDDDDFITPSEGNGATLVNGEATHKTFDKNEGLKCLDIGLSLGVDFKYKCLFAGIGAEYSLLPIDKEFPKDLFKYSFQEDQTLVSPHNIGIEFHVGFCFIAGKR